MWEHLLAVLVLEQLGLNLNTSYEDTLNQYFIENPEDEVLLELEYCSSDLEKSRRIFNRNCIRSVKFDRHQFAVFICEKLEEIYENMPLKEFMPCAYKLWQLLPVCEFDIPLMDLCYYNKPSAKKSLEQADATYREMFRYYSDGHDSKTVDNKPIEKKSISIQEYLSVKPGSIAPDFERAEMLLGFELNKCVTDFYSRVFASKICGEIVIPEEGFIIPIGNKRFDEWFKFNKIKGKTELRLLPCECLYSSAEFIYDSFINWTGGNDFGQRVYIGEFYARIGQISIILNNQTGKVEWVDCGYGHYEKYEKNPHGILAEDIEQFFTKSVKAHLSE